MKIRVMKYILTICLLIEALAFTQETFISKEEFKSDIKFLLSELNLKHPNLYTYSSENDFQEWQANTLSSFDDSVAINQCFEKIATISEIIQDGHSYIYPSKEHLNLFFTSAKVFPFDVFLDENGLFVAADWSTEQKIAVGSKILKINGKHTDSLTFRIIRLSSRNGNNHQYPRHQCYQFFPAQLSYIEGFKNEYELVYLDTNQIVQKVNIQALTRSEIKAKRPLELGKGIYLEIFNESKAILTIKSFGKKILQESYGQKFRNSINKAFKKIKKLKIQHLAIDLRDNQGGELKNGVHLLKYVMEKSFQTVLKFSKLKNGKEITLKNSWNKQHKPFKKNHFDGEVFVFINSGSFSCSSIVSNCIQKQKRALIVGEKSGGSAMVLTGGPFDEIVLPYSKVLVTLPRTKYVLNHSYTEKQSPVTPNVHISDNPTKKTKEIIQYFLEKN